MTTDDQSGAPAPEPVCTCTTFSDGTFAVDPDCAMHNPAPPSRAAEPTLTVTLHGHVLGQCQPEELLRCLWGIAFPGQPLPAPAATPERQP